MTIIEVLVLLVVIGVCLYLVERYVPMSPPIKTVTRVVVVMGLVLFLLQWFGVTNFDLWRRR